MEVLDVSRHSDVHMRYEAMRAVYQKDPNNKDARADAAYIRSKITNVEERTRRLAELRERVVSMPRRWLPPDAPVTSLPSARTPAARARAPPALIPASPPSSASSSPSSSSSWVPVPGPPKRSQQGAAAESRSPTMSAATGLHSILTTTDYPAPPTASASASFRRSSRPLRTASATGSEPAATAADEPAAAAAPATWASQAPVAVNKAAVTSDSRRSMTTHGSSTAPPPPQRPPFTTSWRSNRPAGPNAAPGAPQQLKPQPNHHQQQQATGVSGVAPATPPALSVKRSSSVAPRRSPRGPRTEEQPAARLTAANLRRSVSAMRDVTSATPGPPAAALMMASAAPVPALMPEPPASSAPAGTTPRSHLSQRSHSVAGPTPLPFGQRSDPALYGDGGLRTCGGDGSGSGGGAFPVPTAPELASPSTRPPVAPARRLRGVCGNTAPQLPSPPAQQPPEPQPAQAPRPPASDSCWGSQVDSASGSVTATGTQYATVSSPRDTAAAASGPLPCRHPGAPSDAARLIHVSLSEPAAFPLAPAAAAGAFHHRPSAAAAAAPPVAVAAAAAPKPPCWQRYGKERVMTWDVDFADLREPSDAFFGDTFRMRGVPEGGPRPAWTEGPEGSLGSVPVTSLTGGASSSGFGTGSGRSGGSGAGVGRGPGLLGQRASAQALGAGLWARPGPPGRRGSGEVTAAGPAVAALRDLRGRSLPGGDPASEGSRSESVRVSSVKVDDWFART